MITEADHILQSHLNSKVTPSIAPIAWSKYACFVAKKSGTVLGITIVSCRACTMAEYPSSGICARLNRLDPTAPPGICTLQLCQSSATR
ncbi:hypothetical protein JG688_00001910 [Phytophthora aleatoria]|uniref:Uncharacterized protein n=1 Tax=Phytophthora aleatoria TaxID=2496075 RepID=A0A8J5J1Z1_9STRA|nr:hypothetical protein JG688_00001910 [Phytophthora aleatoria]